MRTRVVFDGGQVAVTIEPTTKAEVAVLGLMEEATRISKQPVRVEIQTDQMGKVTAVRLTGAEWS